MPPKARLTSIDALRGLIMIIMALDHVREFYHSGAMKFRADDLTQTTTILFFTRWITHFCAPVFFFTAGAGAFLWRQRGRSTGELSRFLWTRGLWLVVLELTALRMAMNFSIMEGPLLLTILWALGWSMVALAALVYLPLQPLAILSVAVIALHNLTDNVMAPQLGGFASIWSFLHQPGPITVGGLTAILGYPLVPWFAVMSAGFTFGQVLLYEPERRRRWMMRAGILLTAAFLVIRGLNIYGDPQPWSTQVPGMTILSFLRCTKYPPSLDFLLMTLGPALILLAVFDRTTFSRNNPLIVFGRVPLFYFLGHFVLLHALALPIAYIRYGRSLFLLHPLPSMGGPEKLFPPDFGYSLGFTYMVWAFVVACMYPACRWFAGVKERRRDWWLSYL